MLLGNTAAHCKQNAIRTAMLRYTWRLLQGIYMRVRKHAYTERGQKCAKAYIKRYTTQVTKLARQCSYIMIAWYMMSRDTRYDAMRYVGGRAQYQAAQTHERQQREVGQTAY